MAANTQELHPSDLTLRNKLYTKGKINYKALLKQSQLLVKRLDLDLKDTFQTSYLDTLISRWATNLETGTIITEGKFSCSIVPAQGIKKTDKESSIGEFTSNGKKYCMIPSLEKKLSFDVRFYQNEDFEFIVKKESEKYTLYNDFIFSKQPKFSHMKASGFSLDRLDENAEIWINNTKIKFLEDSCYKYVIYYFRDNEINIVDLHGNEPLSATDEIKGPSEKKALEVILATQEIEFIDRTIYSALLRRYPKMDIDVTYINNVLAEQKLLCLLKWLNKETTKTYIAYADFIKRTDSVGRIVYNNYMGDEKRRCLSKQKLEGFQTTTAVIIGKNVFLIQPDIVHHEQPKDYITLIQPQIPKMIGCSVSNVGSTQRHAVITMLTSLKQNGYNFPKKRIGILSEDYTLKDSKSIIYYLVEINENVLKAYKLIDTEGTHKLMYLGLITRDTLEKRLNVK